MPTRSRTPTAASLACWAAICAGLPAAAQLPDRHRDRGKLPVHHLDNGTVRAGVTDAIGGRLLSFSLRGRQNFLLLDATAGDPCAAPAAGGRHVPFQGHEVWLGPQRDWWRDQDVDPGRAAAAAVWPPDPWLTLARYEIVARGAGVFAVRGPASPLSGMRLYKRYALVDGHSDSLALDVVAENAGTATVARDIWFNTRVPVATEVYVPVAGRADVRAEPDGPLDVRFGDGVLSLSPPAPGQAARKGKLFIQPAAGWIAAFRDGQALVIAFAHQPRAAIHPGQGQVELYQDADPARPRRGLLELEVHAPYVRLAPGARMAAHERWTLLAYEGAATRAAHLAFLRRHAARLGLGGLDRAGPPP